MRSIPRSSKSVLNQIAFLVLFCATAAGAEDLPDAPQQPSYVPVPATRSPSSQAVKRRQWSVVVEPNEKIPALTSREKLLYPVHETFRWSTPVGILYSGWYGILRDNDPHFGINAAGWGERVGAAALRQESTRFFSDGFLPAAFHEDPRYFRKAYGSYPKRGLYAISRAVVSQRDSGAQGFGFSKVIGRGMSAALTQTYYPESSIGSRVVFISWGISISQLAGANLFDEFWPDVKRKFFHRAQ